MAPPACGEPGCCGGEVAQQGVAARLEAVLAAELEASHVRVEDESNGCGAKLNVIVVSPRFEKIPLLAQHRLVNQAAADILKEIHAFRLKTYTPAKWAQLQA